MRQLLRSLLVLTLLLALVPIVNAGAPADEAPQVTLDDEIVLLASDGRIVVRDPYTPPGYNPVSWQSPGNSYGNVVAGDFNGDSSAEIVGIRGGEATVFDPVVMPGSTNLGRTFTAAAGQTWLQAVTGDAYGTGKDTLVLIQSSSQQGLAIEMFAYEWRSGSGWTQVFSGGYGAVWTSIAMGDVDGDGKDEFVAVRNVEFTYQIIMLKPSNNWQTLFSQAYTFPWLTVAVGNTNSDGQNKQELVTTRSDVLGTFPSMLVFRYIGSSSSMETVDTFNYFPYFTKIALGDVNASGIETIYLLRPGLNQGTPIVALTNRYYGSGSVTQFNELAGQERFKNLQTGDIDADGKAELVVMAADEYLIYTEPATSKNLQQVPGSYSSTTNFVLANVDGTGLPSGPALGITPTSITWNLQAGQNAGQQVQISNVGQGTLNWTASVIEGGGWLSINPSSGTAPTTMLASANTTNLLGGTYTGKIRVTGVGGNIGNSPVDINVSLTVTAPQFSAQPTKVSWYYRPPTGPGANFVQVFGPSINWHAGAVPTSLVPQIEEAIAAGKALRWNDGLLLIDGQPLTEDVPVVLWIDINPTEGTATQSGTSVQLNLVTAEAPYGFNTAAVVFVADQVASPPAVVVRASVLRSLANQSDLTFLPSIQ